MYVTWLLVILLNFTPRVANGFSGGAPPSRCDNMIPAHRQGSNQILPQRSPLPYNFKLSKFTYSPGEQITMTLSGGQAGYLQGFLVKVIDNQGVAVGTMTAPRGLQTITCGLNGNEAVTHTEGSRKPGVRFSWTAPSDARGELSVRATVVYNFATFWVNAVIARIQPAPSVQPQITTVSVPVTTGPELTTLLPDTTKQPELTTPSKVITSTETLINDSDVTDIVNTTIVGRDNAHIENEITNSSPGLGTLSVEDNVSYSITNTSYNNTSKLIHDIAASLMMSKISNLADDYFAFTNSLDNGTMKNISELGSANPEATFLSVLDVKNEQKSVNETDSASQISESTYSSKGTNTTNTLQGLNITRHIESSTQSVHVNTSLTNTDNSLKQTTLLPITTFSKVSTTHSDILLTNTKAPPLEDLTLETNTTNSNTPTSVSYENNRNHFPELVNQTSSKVFTIHSYILRANNRTPPLEDLTLEKNTTNSDTLTSLSYENNTNTNHLTELVNQTSITPFQTTSLSIDLLDTTTLSTSQTTQNTRDDVTQMNTDMFDIDEQDNTALNKITDLPTHTTELPSSTANSDPLNYTNESGTGIINITTNLDDKHELSTTDKNVPTTKEIELKETTETKEYTEPGIKSYSNTDHQTTRESLQTTKEITTIAIPYVEDTTEIFVSETTYTKTSVKNEDKESTSALTTVTRDISKIQEFTTLHSLTSTEDKTETSSVALNEKISTTNTLSSTVETTTTKFESTTQSTQSIRSLITELTTVTTLPPIIPRTFPIRKPRPKLGPHTKDVWLKMNPSPVTVNNLFKLMPTTRRVWLKVEPTMTPPAFVQPVFKAPPLPESTSTVKPTRVTTFIEPHVKVVPAVLQDGLIEYDPACGSSKGCFVDCTNDGCKFMVTWEDVGYGVRFELYGKTKHSDSWIAVGFSKDTRMSDDSVVECIHSGGIVQAFNSYNPANVMNNNRLTVHATTGISEVSGSYYNGVFKCRFTRAYRVDVEPRIFDLQKDWNIMFAHGSLAFGSVAKNMHTEMPAASASRVDYQSVVVIGKAATFTLVKVHGCMMILSWVLFCGVGICVARYYKNVWSDKTFLKLKIWFQVHRACMVTALVLDLIAFIIIFVDVKGYSQIPDIPGKSYLKSHPVLGIVVTLLCVANPIMALFRPGPTDSKRPIFNWAHWGVGISAYILSALTICFGFELGKASTPDYAVYIMIGYIVYIVLFDIACEVHDFLTKKEKKGKSNAMEMSNHNGTDNGIPNGNSTNYTTKEKTKKSDKLKTALLAFHIAFTGAFALVLVLVVALN